MAGPIVARDRRPGAWGTLARALLLAAFAAVSFLAGRLWSVREARDAQRAAGLAEQERLALQAELTACRNALLLQRGREELPPGGGRDDNGVGSNGASGTGGAP